MHEKVFEVPLESKSHCDQHEIMIILGVVAMPNSWFLSGVDNADARVCIWKCSICNEIQLTAYPV